MSQCPISSSYACSEHVTNAVIRRIHCPLIIWVTSGVTDKALRLLIIMNYVLRFMYVQLPNPYCFSLAPIMMMVTIGIVMTMVIVVAIWLYGDRDSDGGHGAI